MRYFFILGSNPVLSAAEIIALLDGRYFTVTETYRHALIVDALEGHELDAAGLMARLGGTIKIGRLLADGIGLDPQDLEDLMYDHLLPMSTGPRLTFGYSIYSLESNLPGNRAAIASGKLRNSGMRVKERLVAAEHSTRWVKAQDGTALSSVVVEKNRMTTEGAEFVVLVKGDKCHVGVTTVVQPFEDFSVADYGRPDRDTYQGMLPPKLARIMINLIHVSREVTDVRLLDPFCGSGTVLSEALRMGFTDLVGSDRNAEAVKATRTNLDWIAERWPDTIPSDAKQEVFQSDAREVSAKLPPDSIDAVVAELYLGNPKRGGEKRGDLQRELGELQKMYREAFANWRRCLKPGAPIVVAFPVYIYGPEKHGIIVKEFESLGLRPEPLLPSPMLARLGIRETKNHGLLYGRNDQRVWREIVRLRYEG